MEKLDAAMTTGESSDSHEARLGDILARLHALGNDFKEVETPAEPTPNIVHADFSESAAHAPVAVESPVVPAARMFEAPVVEAPVVEAPAVETPVAEAPAFAPLEFETPSFEAPDLEAQTSEAPTFEAPAAHQIEGSFDATAAVNAPIENEELAASYKPLGDILGSDFNWNEEPPAESVPAADITVPYEAPNLVETVDLDDPIVESSWEEPQVFEYYETPVAPEMTAPVMPVEESTPATPAAFEPYSFEASPVDVAPLDPAPFEATPLEVPASEPPAPVAAPVQQEPALEMLGNWATLAPLPEAPSAAPAAPLSSAAPLSFDAAQPFGDSNSFAAPEPQSFDVAPEPPKPSFSLPMQGSTFGAESVGKHADESVLGGEHARGNQEMPGNLSRDAANAVVDDVASAKKGPPLILRLIIAVLIVVLFLAVLLSFA